VHFGFTKNEILSLWGELYNWAIAVNNLKICPNESTKTKYEIYKNVKPDLRSIRLLPILCVLYVLRRTKSKHPLKANKDYWQRALYTGPSIVIPGAIRAVVKTAHRLKIITTTAFKAVSDGGLINPQINIEHVLDTNDNETKNNNIDKEFNANKDANDDKIENEYNETDSDHNEMNPKISVKDNNQLKDINTNVNNRAKTTMQNQVKQWGTRDERLAKREKMKNSINCANTAIDMINQRYENKDHIVEAYFVDWSTHTEDSEYYSYSADVYIKIATAAEDSILTDYIIEEGYKAVTSGVPKTFTAALEDPIWGDAARKEYSTIFEQTRSVIECNQQIAKEMEQKY
jgi:hypothetical protein